MSDMFADHVKSAAKLATDLLAQFATQTGNQKGAQSALDAAKLATGSLQVDLLLSGAKSAFSANLQDDAIVNAIDNVIKNNASYQAKTAGTVRKFASQLKLAMSLHVRKVAPSLVAFATEAWDAEKAAIDANAKAPKPLRDLWHARPQMVVKLFSEVKDNHGNVSFPSAASIVAFAVENDPSKDAVKVAKRLKKLIADIAEIHGEFPAKPLKAGLDLFKTFTAEELLAARKAAQDERDAAEDEAVKSDPHANVTNLRAPDGTVKETSEAPSGLNIADALGEANAQVAA